jgi:hypothetical protein
MMRWIMLCRAQLAATILPAGWITMVGGAFLLSLFFLVSFIAAEAWMSRQPMSLRSICSNVLNLYRNRDEITDNERWRQELKNLHDDCSVALYKYDPTSPTYGLTSFDSTRPTKPQCIRQRTSGETNRRSGNWAAQCLSNKQQLTELR